MKKSESIEIRANADKVWSVAAKEFEHIHIWASNVSESEALPRQPAQELAEPPECGGRVCKTPQGKTVETLTEYSDTDRSLTYEITGDAMPGFVQHATNTWTVKSLGEGRAQLTMSVAMTTAGVMGFVMRPLMKVGMGKLLRTNLEELKHYIETGQQHARKAKKARA